MADNSPSLSGYTDPASFTGMEPGLGGLRRVQVDPRLLASLLDDGAAAWHQAVNRIVTLGQGRIYALELVKIIAAGDRTRYRQEGYHAEQRIAATRALEAFGSDVATTALVDALGDRQWWVGQYAIDALVAIGVPAVDALLDAIDNPHAIVRRRIADVLGEIGDWRATGPLLDLLANDPSDWVRTRAARALGALRNRHAAEGLRRAGESDDDSAVRTEARRALQALGMS